MAGISQKIELQGEKEYRQAIKNAERELKTLEARLKAETAELGKNASEQEKNAAKVKSLQKQIAEQEKIVQTYTDALKEVQEKYADNADEIAKWETKLLKARETLANMRNSMASASEGLQEVKTGMEGVGAASDSAVVAARSVTETIGDLANIGDGISDGIENIFKGMVSSVKEAITEVWGEISDLAARSNALLDMAGFWNTDVTTLQKYKGAVANINGDLSDLNDIVTKINAKDSKKITELVGISKEGYQDDWKYAMAVMDALAEMREKNFQAGNNAAFELFGGRQATKAMDLLNDWRELQDNLARYDVDAGGYGMSEEQIQQMSDLADRISGLKNDWQSLKDMLLVKLTAELGLDVTSNAQGLLDGFLEFMNADSDEEKQAAITKMRENIEAIFQAIREAIEAGIQMMKDLSEDLKKSEDPLVQALGNVLSGVADVMQWFTEDNAKNAATALAIVAGAWAASNVLTMIGNITKLAAAARTIKLFGGLGSLLGGGGNGTTPTVTPTTTPTTTGNPATDAATGAATGGVMVAIRNKVTQTAANASTALAQTGGMMPALGDRLINETNAGRALRDGGDVLEGIGQDIEEKKTEIEKNASTFWDDWGNLFRTAGDNAARYWNQVWYGNENGPQQKTEQRDAAQDEPIEQNPGPDTWEVPAGRAPLEEEELLEDDYALRLSKAQREAIEDYWDFIKGPYTDTGYKVTMGNLSEAFSDMPAELNELIERINGMTHDDDLWSMKDLPEWWFQDARDQGKYEVPADWWKTGANADGITSQDLQNFDSLPSRLERSVENGMAKVVGSISFDLDGYRVARILAPMVSQEIAKDMV